VAGQLKYRLKAPLNRHLHSTCGGPRLGLVLYFVALNFLAMAGWKTVELLYFDLVFLL
jgi:hypothetical protein